MPIVAMSSTSRGASARRRMTTTSRSMAESAATGTATRMHGHRPQPCSVSTPNAPRATAPNATTAKLMIPLARYTRMSPAAIALYERPTTAPVITICCEMSQPCTWIIDGRSPRRRIPGRRGREHYVGGALVGLPESCDTPSGGVDHAAFDVGGIMSYARRSFLVRGTIGALVAALALGLTAGVGAGSAGAVAPTVTPDPATSPFTSTTAFCTKDTEKHTGLKATGTGVTADKISVVAIEPALAARTVAPGLPLQPR